MSWIGAAQSRFVRNKQDPRPVCRPLFCEDVATVRSLDFAEEIVSLINLENSARNVHHRKSFP
jgi:hypothetical protein